MGRVAIISVDGHVKASRRGLPRLHRAEVPRRLRRLGARAEDTPDGHPSRVRRGRPVGPEARVADLETPGRGGRGAVPERSAVPGEPRRGFAPDPELPARATAYNRWLADFCAEAPGRRAGQAVVSFDDVDQAVKDVHWAKEHGLGGIMMPALNPGGINFFDPVLDPIWAACPGRRPADQPARRRRAPRLQRARVRRPS